MVVATADGTVTIPDENRSKCERWTRVMGYYRPLSEYNTGKKQEVLERVDFCLSCVEQ
jgi:anaerobic ribonucleoside-triphosphate reductase